MRRRRTLDRGGPKAGDGPDIRDLPMDATRTPTRSLRRPARLGEYGRARTVTASAGYEQPPFRGTEIGGGPAHNLPEETTLRRRIWRRAALGSPWVSFPIPGRRAIRRQHSRVCRSPGSTFDALSPTSRDSESSGLAPIRALVINRRTHPGNGAENFGTTAGDCSRHVSGKHSNRPPRKAGGVESSGPRLGTALPRNGEKNSRTGRFSKGAPN
jgi:hypothetical protein